MTADGTPETAEGTPVVTAGRRISTASGVADDDGLDIPAASPGVSPTKRRHLYEIDILRILTFVCVISVHSVSHSASATDVWQNGFLILVHFTRELFFALTTFVLTLSYLARPIPLRKFWPRRFLLVGVPYVTWSFLYPALAWLRRPSGTLDSFLLTFWRDLYEGTAWYHLYFLLVTMQVYLLLPLLVWMIRKTRRHHWAVLAFAFAFALVLTWCIHYHPSYVIWIDKYNRIEFTSYLFFIVAGAVAADHATEFLAWVRHHRRLIVGLTAVGAAASIGVYVYNMAIGESAVTAATALQPIVIVWSIPVGLVFLVIGAAWADRRRPDSRSARLVDTATDRSFGIFLAHPLLIWFLLWVGGGWIAHTLPYPLLSPVLYVLVVVGTVLLVEILRRTPASLALTGRPFRARDAAGR